MLELAYVEGKKKGIKTFQIQTIPFTSQKKDFLKTGDNSVQKFSHQG